MGVHQIYYYAFLVSPRNQSGQTPYLVAKDKAVRDTFRRFMATYPSMYDYTAAQIPSPLTEDMERERKEKLAEKKKAQKKARKLKEKVISNSPLKACKLSAHR